MDGGLHDLHNILSFFHKARQYSFRLVDLEGQLFVVVALMVFVADNVVTYFLSNSLILLINRPFRLCVGKTWIAFVCVHHRL